jgi:hypothetical protein
LSAGTGHFNRGIDGVFEKVRVVGGGLVSIAEVHAIGARAHLAQGEAEMASDRFGFLERHSLRDDYGSDDMAVRTKPNPTTATVETISTTAFPKPSTISNATVFHGVLLVRVKLSDIGFFPLVS